MMRFIEKNPTGDKPLILSLSEDRESPPKTDSHLMDFSLLTQNHKDVADGRCYVVSESGANDMLYIAVIFVDGNSNKPTKIRPNRYVGLGQILVFAAIKFGLELNLTNVGLDPIPGSEGFYLKMGFRPKVTGNPNRMMVDNTLPMSVGKKINPQWARHFAQSSFLHDSFRGQRWVGSIPLIYPRLLESISRSWTIVGA